MSFHTNWAIFGESRCAESSFPTSRSAARDALHICGIYTHFNCAFGDAALTNREFDASAVFFEWGYRKLLKKPSSIGDLSACLTGLLLAFVLPTNAPWWLPIIGNFFAISIIRCTLN